MSDHNRAFLTDACPHCGLIELAAGGVWVLDTAGRTLFANARLAEMLGRAGEALGGVPADQLVHEDDLAEVTAWAAAPGVRTEVGPFRLKGPGGADQWVLAATAPLPADGAVPGTVAMLLDASAAHAARERLQRSEEGLRGLVGSGLIGVVVTRDGIVQAANPRAAEIYGFASDAEMVGQVLGDRFDAEGRRRVDDLGRPAGAESREVTPQTLPGRRADGTEVLVEIVGGVILHEEREAVMSFHQDVTGRRRAEQALRASEERFRAAFENAPIGMALVDVRAGREGRFMQVNDALCAMLGHEREHLVGGMGLADVTHPDELERDLAQLGRLVTGAVDLYRLEKRFLHADGHPIWGEFTATLVRDAAGSPAYGMGQIQDVTEPRRLERHLRYVADHDFLTGLLNRRRFEEELGRETRRIARDGSAATLVLLDLDEFKYVNDTFGHRVGDDVIREVGALLRRRMRETDVVARLGGDEFAALLPGTDHDGARHVADDLVNALRTTRVLAAGQELRISASVGVVPITPGDSRAPDELLADADVAMYEAKESGRGRFAVVEAGAGRERARVRLRLDWSQRLRHALEEERFELHSQPIIDIVTGAARRHELLLRMRSGTGRLVWPVEFLGHAERLGLIGDIDALVLRQALALASRVARAGVPAPLHVNVAGASLAHASVTAILEDLADGTVVPPGAIVIELTESTVIGDLVEAADLAARLRKAGVGFALDDFGSGFGSLTSLKSLPFDYLKVDGGFVHDLRHSATDRAVVRAAVEIAATLGMSTVAEHVPDEWTMGFLRDAGVDLAQGFFLGMPRPVEEWLGEMGA